MPKASAPLPISPELLDAAAVSRRFGEVRARTEALAAPLSVEDAQVQSMPDVSPTKWHLAHTSWFFETFLLRELEADYAPFDADFHYLFNSYYEAEGPRHARPCRGLVTRPGLETVHAYRHAVTERLLALVQCIADRDDWPRYAALIELGCHHEEQHQELILTDIKHVLAQNPIAPRYKAPYPKPIRTAPPLRWHDFEGGAAEIGHEGDSFAFDNERPRHKRWLAPFALASRPVTNGEYIAFIEDGGYRAPGHWLSDGRVWVERGRRTAPLYWEKRDGEWLVFTLYGLQPVNRDEPVCHLSFYEADAYASWAGARLPREEEIEIAWCGEEELGPVNDLRSGRMHPTVARHDGKAQLFAQLAGDVWEWTLSSYSPYPGFAPAPGVVGEYNGKFMCDQYVLKGGSCATPPGHWRATYRNFFPAAAQWQFSGLRLARDR